MYAKNFYFLNFPHLLLHDASFSLQFDVLLPFSAELNLIIIFDIQDFPVRVLLNLFLCLLILFVLFTGFIISLAKTK